MTTLLSLHKKKQQHFQKVKKTPIFEIFCQLLRRKVHPRNNGQNLYEPSLGGRAMCAGEGPQTAFQYCKNGIDGTSLSVYLPFAFVVTEFRKF